MFYSIIFVVVIGIIVLIFVVFVNAALEFVVFSVLLLVTIPTVVAYLGLVDRVGEGGSSQTQNDEDLHG